MNNQIYKVSFGHKRFNFSILLLFAMMSSTIVQSQTVEKNVEHIKVYYEKGMYGGWPANHGIWSWDNEILVGFLKGLYQDRGPRSHNMDSEGPQATLFARSKDGGLTWSIEDPGAGVGLRVPDCEAEINFTHPDFALTARGDNFRSFIFYSYDRGKHWEGPCPLPNFNTPGIAARTDYLVNGEKECVLFLTAAKSDADEGRVISVKTVDGGKTWNFVSWIGPEPEGYSIMPASVRLSGRELLVAMRRKEGRNSFIALYHSGDGGLSWDQLDNPVDDTGVGNPPAMIRLNDGRLCLIYGYRAEEEAIRNKRETSDIRAKLSDDNGRTWSKDYILRNDGSGRDLGYPRVVQRPDGKIVALYYFMDKKSGPERYIAATIWDPPAK